EDAPETSDDTETQAQTKTTAKPETASSKSAPGSKTQTKAKTDKASSTTSVTAASSESSTSVNKTDKPASKAPAQTEADVKTTKTQSSKPAATSTAEKTTTSATKTTSAAKKTSASKVTVSEIVTSSSQTDTQQSAAEQITLTEMGEGSFTFVCGGETFNAYYTPDNWKIIDSYKITKKADMVTICTALSEIHPIHNKDYTGYREPDDLAYEWEQHNIAYELLPDSSKWKQNTKDVDLDPKDQGKSFIDMAKDRLGK
ncbi:MAG: hypothetical protein IKR76_08125, partial [Ruminococcus sp.]|nr:hypothetical protein [Ruminococcus sp.]